MQSVRRKVKCPTCGTMAVWDTANRWRPFCSERCKQLDLGAWSAGQYTIAENHPAEPNDSGAGD